MTWSYVRSIGKNISSKCQPVSLTLTYAISHVHHSIRTKTEYTTVHKWLGIVHQRSIAIINFNVRKNIKDMDFSVINSAF
jgi:hypothetical protein